MLSCGKTSDILVCKHCGNYTDGHARKLVVDNCGESLRLVNYHVIYGCVGGHRSKPDTITEEAI